LDAAVSSSPPPYPQPDHPDVTTTFVLGILGLVLCQLLSPFAWIMGSRVVAEIDGSRGAYGGRGLANAGRICGIVGTVMMVVVIVLLFVVVAS
jgi:hypothetical protein